MDLQGKLKDKMFSRNWKLLLSKSTKEELLK